MSIEKLKYPELLIVEETNGARRIGGEQYWFPAEGFIPMGACGATTASNIFAYYLRVRPEEYMDACEAGLTGIGAPWPDREANTKTDYLEFMKKIYEFLHPNIGGLMADGFVEGVNGLAMRYKLAIEAENLRVPISRKRRPSFDESANFICSSLAAEVPVAFLTLSSGCVANIDTWHWVTILSIDTGTRQIELADNGEALWADLGMWLDTSIMGGSFVRIKTGTNAPR